MKPGKGVSSPTGSITRDSKRPAGGTADGPAMGGRSRQASTAALPGARPGRVRANAL